MYIQTNMLGLAGTLPSGLEVRQADEDVQHCLLEPAALLRGHARPFTLNEGQSCQVFEVARSLIRKRWIQVLPSSASDAAGYLRIFANQHNALVYEIDRLGGQFSTEAGAALTVQAIAGPVRFLVAEEAYD